MTESCSDVPLVSSVLSISQTCSQIFLNSSRNRWCGKADRVLQSRVFHLLEETWHHYVYPWINWLLQRCISVPKHFQMQNSPKLWPVSVMQVAAGDWACWVEHSGATSLLWTSSSFYLLESRVTLTQFVLWNHGFGPFSDGEMLASATLQCLLSAWVEWMQEKER